MIASPPRGLAQHILFSALFLVLFGFHGGLSNAEDGLSPLPDPRHQWDAAQAYSLTSDRVVGIYVDIGSNTKIGDAKPHIEDMQMALTDQGIPSRAYMTRSNGSAVSVAFFLEGTPYGPVPWSEAPRKASEIVKAFHDPLRVRETN